MSQMTKPKIKPMASALKPRNIMGRRSSFNGAFAAALALRDNPKSPEIQTNIAEASKFFDRNADGDLLCIYCDEIARTWDHLNNTTLNSRFSGFGHQVFNLVPACRTCNETKRKLSWTDFLAQISIASSDEKRREKLTKYHALLKNRGLSEEELAERFPNEMKRYAEVREKVFELLREADELAGRIRELASTDASAPVEGA
jgi:hypothetical protein